VPSRQRVRGFPSNRNKLGRRYRMGDLDFVSVRGSHGMGWRKGGERIQEKATPYPGRRGSAPEPWRAREGSANCPVANRVVEGDVPRRWRGPRHGLAVGAVGGKARGRSKARPLAVKGLRAAWGWLGGRLDTAGRWVQLRRSPARGELYEMGGVGVGS